MVCACWSGVHSPHRSRSTTSSSLFARANLSRLRVLRTALTWNAFEERTRRSQTTQDDAVVNVSRMRVSVGGEVLVDRGPREKLPTNAVG
jgi:hypothetical protein